MSSATLGSRDAVVMLVHDESAVMWSLRNLKLVILSTAVPLMWIRVCSVLCFQKSTIQSFEAPGHLEQQEFSLMT
jgi:hypothetical protein